jgi:hypothetical protein
MFRPKLIHKFYSRPPPPPKAKAKQPSEAVRALDDDRGDDPLIIAVISVAIVVVAGALAGVLSAYFCKRCQYQKPPSGSSPAYASDVDEEDVYLDDIGDGDFFEWPRTPLRPTQQLLQKQVIVEYSRGYAEGYCRLTSGVQTTEL